MSEEGGEERTVPYSRFQEVVGKKNAAEAQIADLQAQLQAASEKSATADTLAQTIAELKTGHKSQIAALHEELGLSRAGLNNPEGVAVARALYGAQPEDSRPKSLLEYVNSFKAEGENVPKPPPGLAPYLDLPKPQAKEPETNGKPVGDLARLRAYGAPGRGSSAPGAPDVSAEAIRQAKAQFSRNPTEENAKSLKALLRGA